MTEVVTQTMLSFENLKAMVLRDRDYKGIKSPRTYGVIYGARKLKEDIVEHALRHLARFGEQLAQAIVTTYRSCPNEGRFLTTAEGRNALCLDTTGHLVHVMFPIIEATESASPDERRLTPNLKITSFVCANFLSGPSIGQRVNFEGGVVPEPVYQRGVIYRWAESQPPPRAARIYNPACLAGLE
jgi:hypothetical protein